MTRDDYACLQSFSAIVLQNHEKKLGTHGDEMADASVWFNNSAFTPLSRDARMAGSPHVAIGVIALFYSLSFSHRLPRE